MHSSASSCGYVRCILKLTNHVISISSMLIYRNLHKIEEDILQKENMKVAVLETHHGMPGKCTSELSTLMSKTYERQTESKLWTHRE